MSYTFAKWIWVAADGTYYSGGGTQANGGPTTARQDNSRIGLIAAITVGKGAASEIQLLRRRERARGIEVRRRLGWGIRCFGSDFLTAGCRLSAVACYDERGSQATADSRQSAVGNPANLSDRAVVQEAP